jgi:transposase-like protein
MVWGAVQALKERGMSKKQMARELGLDLKTLRKWWKRSWRPQRRAKRVRRVDRFATFVAGRAPPMRLHPNRGGSIRSRPRGDGALARDVF